RGNGAPSGRPGSGLPALSIVREPPPPGSSCPVNSQQRQVVLLGLLAAACRAAAPRAELPLPPPAPAPGDTTCSIAAGRAAGRDTVRLAVTDPVDPGHAPLPRNDAERLVFGQLYESLIRVDCQGRPLPGLAAAWEEAPGDRWAFTLRDNARFWDGAPVSARDVLASWRSHDATLAASLTVTGDRTFTVAASDAPFQRLADQALAVAKPAPGGGWPIGTGRYWMTSGDPASPDALVAQPMARSGQPVVEIATGPAGAAASSTTSAIGAPPISRPASWAWAPWAGAPWPRASPRAPSNPRSGSAPTPPTCSRCGGASTMCAVRRSSCRRGARPPPSSRCSTSAHMPL